MMNRRWYPVLVLFLAVAYVAVAAINRQYSWAWGREWLAPTMMLAVLLAVLVGGCMPRSRGYRRWN
jgi:hypothetical protein